MWRACAVERDGTFVVAAVPTGAHRHAVRELARGMAAIVVVALLGMWLAVRRAIRGPLAELDAVVRWTARIVDASPAVLPPPARTREIVQLEMAFDALVRRLFDALARERASSAHMAHELRTPLTAMVTELQGLRTRAPEAADAIDRVLEDVSRFTDVIEAILVLSAGPLAGVRVETVVNLADLAREMAPAGTAVEAPDEALVETDERLVRLALRNLVDNARKYASGARVIRVSRRGADACLAVVDDGPGLDANARERMFERYWRGSADGEGRGLGLALVRAVAERYGGHAEARPAADGTGLEISMTFKHLVGWHVGSCPPAGKPRSTNPPSW
jgi:signal transduction histidine kinase